MTFPIRIIPRYRLIVRYDIRLDRYEAYYQFVMNDFEPAMRHMGLYMVGIWQTVYGDYPVRQIEFVTESLDTVREVFQSERWEALEDKLKSYTLRYERKLVRYREQFQF